MNYDVMILGAGVAGTTAAIRLRRKQSTVVLIDRAGRPARNAHSPEWLSASAHAQLKEMDIDLADCLGSPFTGIVFHSADLKKKAVAVEKSPPAYRIDFPRLIERMQTTVAAEDAKIIYEAAPTRIDLGEKQVGTDFADAKPVRSSFLLVADGACRTFAPMNGGNVPTNTQLIPASTPGRWVATLELPGGKSREAKAAADEHMHWLLGTNRRQACLLWWWVGATCVLRMVTDGTGSDAARRLCAATTRLIDAGLIVSRTDVCPEAVVLHPAPVRSALEIDSHVNKRTLLIGDAGGFVSETSGEGIYPAIWSAQLATECLLAAEGSAHPQDELRRFSSAWRSTMADYLRAPNTDVHFLLPLIFSNQQMADRMAAAFWTGTNI